MSGFYEVFQCHTVIGLFDFQKCVITIGYSALRNYHNSLNGISYSSWKYFHLTITSESITLYICYSLSTHLWLLTIIICNTCKQLTATCFLPRSVLLMSPQLKIKCQLGDFIKSDFLITLTLLLLLLNQFWDVSGCRCSFVDIKYIKSLNQLSLWRRPEGWRVRFLPSKGNTQRWAISFIQPLLVSLWNYSRLAKHYLFIHFGCLCWKDLNLYVIC